MLAIEADAFSGRENPRWVLEDGDEARDILRKVSLNRQALAPADVARQVLGFRGLVVHLVDDSLSQGLDLPTEFRIASGTSGNDAAGVEIAEQILERMPSERDAFLSAEGVDEDLRSTLLQELREFPSVDSPPAESGPLYGGREPVQLDELATEADSEAKGGCEWIATPFNPGFWNNDPFVRGNNNCYNYACNRRTNTFAQPGRGAGSMWRSLDCPEVSRAAQADGNHIWGVCFPPGTAGLWIMALVMAPGIDYHWYRFMSNGFWTHKPGGTPATDVDNCGKPIPDPRTACRGRYTQFCGFFQTATTVKVQ